MKLRLPAFEKAVRRRVREELRRSPKLRRQARRATTRIVFPGWLFPVLFLWLVGIALWNQIRPPGHILEARLAVATLWMLGISYSSIARLEACLYQAQELIILYHLPLADLTILRRRAGDYLRWALFTAWMWAPFGLWLDPEAEHPWSAWLGGVGLFLALFLSARALAVHVVAWGWQRQLIKLWLGFPAALALAIGAHFFAPALTGLFRALMWTPIFGWLAYLYQYGLRGGDPWVWTLLLPVAAVFWTLPFSWRRLKAEYRLPEPEFPPTALAEELEQNAGDEIEARDGAALSGGVRSRAFLAAADWWRAGWYERLAARLLTARERRVTELLLPETPQWSTGYQRRGIAWLVGVGLTVSLSTLLNWNWVWVLPLLIALGGMLEGANIEASGRDIGGISVPLFALFPVGYREVGRIVMKLSLLGLVLHLPFLAGTAWVAAWSWDLLNYRLAGVFLAKGVGVFIAALPMLAVFFLSTRSNDSRRAGCLSVLLLGLFVLVGIGGMVGVFLIPDPRAVLICLGALAACSWLIYGAHSLAWARGWFDLIQPEEEAE